MNEQFNDFNEQQKEVLHLLKLLNDNKVLEHVILIGSWSEYIYAQADVLADFSITLRTIDVDFLVKNLRKPTVPVYLPALAEEEGFSVEHDVLMGTTKLHSPEGLEIEFLIQQKGSGVEPVLKTNLGVKAQALRHMGAIIDNVITVDFLGMKLQVPCPESYVLTKMIINDVRTPDKQRKDTVSVINLLPYLNFKKLVDLFEASTKNEKKRVLAFIEKNSEEMDRELPLDTRMKMAELVARNGHKNLSKAVEKSVSLDR